jgi:hypothetical protein
METGIVFLFGAGASTLVDLPTMDELWEDYFKNYQWDKDEIAILENVMKKEYGKADIEYLLSMISELNDPIQRRRLDQIYPQIEASFTSDNFVPSTKPVNEKLESLRADVEGHIRKRLENIDRWKVGLYKPIFALTNPLKIFTLNYDGLIEILCDLSAKTYSDGFSPEWNPSDFDNKEVQLFKLHGSLFWLKNSSGKYFKVPIKGLNLGNTKYMSDEELSEMVIYPSMNKHKYTEVYTWLHNKFIEELKKAKICVVLGYSFRDKEIKDILIESVKNRDLRLLIISPHSNKTKDTLVNCYDLDLDTRSKIIRIEDKAEIITSRKLGELIPKVIHLISSEKEIWKEQYERNTLNQKWEQILKGYRQIDASDRIRYILEETKNLSIKSSNGHTEKSIFPVFIESISYYLTSNEKEKLELWFDYLVTFCKAIDQNVYERLGIQSSIQVYTEHIIITNIELNQLMASLRELESKGNNTSLTNIITFLEQMVSADLRSTGSIGNECILRNAYSCTNLYNQIMDWKKSIFMSKQIK